MESTYRVPDMTCGHCTAAVEREVLAVDGVRGVEADLETKLVRISGESFDEAAIRAAIDEAGYQAEAA